VPNHGKGCRSPAVFSFARPEKNKGLERQAHQDADPVHLDRFMTPSHEEQGKADL